MERILVGRDKFKNLKIYLGALVLSLPLLFLVFYLKDFYPLGENLLQYQDGDQYLSFLSYVQQSLYSSDNLLYTWNSLLGTNFVGTYAYYAASVFNFLIIFFPGNLMLGYHIIYMIEWCCAVLCFAICAREVFPNKRADFIIILSACYPLVSYYLHYTWNQSWIGGMVFLPLVALGLWRILRGKQIYLYTFSLAVALYSNYYTGYEICITAFFLLLAAFIAGVWRGKWYYVLLKWFVGTVIAVGLVAFLLLPTYRSLPPDRQKSFEIVSGNLSEINNISLASMFFTDPFNGMSQNTNSPLIGIGVVQLIGLSLFFANNKINWRQKAASIFIIVIFICSFYSKGLTNIWHGFSDNMWYNYRYSFTCAFFLYFLSLYGFLTFPVAKKRYLGIAVGLLVLLVYFAYTDPHQNLQEDTKKLDILILALGMVLYTLALCFYRRRWIYRFALATLAIVMGYSGIYNANLVLNEYGSYSRYLSISSRVQNILNIIQEDTDFYRIGLNTTYEREDGSLYGYKGVECYTSAASRPTLVLLSDLGFTRTPWGSSYNSNIPISSESLVGFKYVELLDDKKTLYFDLIDSDSNLYINPYALPLVFPIESDEEISSNDYQNNFEYLNAVWNSLTSVGGDIFTPVEFKGRVSMIENIPSALVTFTAPQDGPYYVQIPSGKDVSTSLDYYSSNQKYNYIGNLSQGEKVNFYICYPSYRDELERIVVYHESIPVLEEKVSQIDRSIKIQEISSSHLKFTYSGDTEFLGSGIPYDKGWEVYIDGSRVKSQEVSGGFFGFAYPAGDHVIELVYWPPGYLVGVGVSLIALGIILTMGYIDWKRKL